MQVMCIKSFKEAPAHFPRPEVGDLDVVTEEEVTNLGNKAYVLGRFTNYRYRADHFATLPDTPAEVIEETETELVTA